MKKPLFFLVCALVGALVGCSEQPPAPKVEKTPEPVTGQTALFRMYQVARTWAPDVQVLKMESILLTDVPQVRGKAGAWQATFTSADKNMARSYTYSVAEEQGNLHQGVFAGAQESWSGASGKPFVMSTVKIDSDAAYKTARAKAGDYEKTSPTKVISFSLERQDKFPDPAWRVIWGESAGTSGLSILVDASTGEYLQTLH
ncbi:MAG TPA: hypothetical protein VJ732_00250 [Bryobacteraceae bacterium]|nr:hypothetical protein [Bryobacteraceae bacterium]